MLRSNTQREKQKGIPAIAGLHRNRPDDFANSNISSAARDAANLIYECPKFHKCRANICPLDQDHLKRRHIHGEAICAFLWEAERNNGRLPESMDVSKEISVQVERAFNGIKRTFCSIHSGLSRAKNHPSRLGRSPFMNRPSNLKKVPRISEYPVEKTKVPYWRSSNRYIDIDIDSFGNSRDKETDTSSHGSQRAIPHHTEKSYVSNPGDQGHG